MSWQLAAIIQLLSSATFSLVYRRFAEKYHAHAEASTALMYLLVISPIAIITALVVGGVSLSFPALTWFFILLGGILFATANITAFKASSKIDAAQFALLGNFRTLGVIGLTYLILNEYLDAKQVIGTILLFSATIMIANIHFNKKTYKFTSYSLLAFMSSMLFAAGIVNEKYLLNTMSITSYLIVGWGFQSITMGIIAAKDHKSVMQIIRSKALGGVLTLGLLRTLSGLAFVYALNETTNTSQFASILSYKSALVVIGSYFILREKSHPKLKLASTVIATVGFLLLI